MPKLNNQEDYIVKQKMSDLIILTVLVGAVIFGLFYVIDLGGKNPVGLKLMISGVGIIILLLVSRLSSWEMHFNDKGITLKRNNFILKKETVILSFLDVEIVAFNQGFRTDPMIQIKTLAGKTFKILLFEKLTEVDIF